MGPLYYSYQSVGHLASGVCNALCKRTEIGWLTFIDLLICLSYEQNMYSTSIDMQNNNATDEISSTIQKKLSTKSLELHFKIANFWAWSAVEHKPSNLSINLFNVCSLHLLNQPLLTSFKTVQSAKRVCSPVLKCLIFHNYLNFTTRVMSHWELGANL